VDLEHFVGHPVVVTEKLDGENTSLYRDYIHARSIDGRHHRSRDWVKRFHAGMAHLIPEGWRLCGENLYGRHSIAYTALESYFYLFSVWNEHNVALSWDETLEWSALLDLALPRVLFEGVWDEKRVREIKVQEDVSEGYVVRLRNSFKYEAFGESVAKWVRPGHVQTDEHWMNAAIVPNELRKD